MARWAMHELGTARLEAMGLGDFGPCASVGIEDEDCNLVAVAVFNNFRPPNVEVTFVTSTPRWQSRRAVRDILSYPFYQLCAKRVTAITEVTNTPARAFLCRLGFVEEGTHPDYLPSGDAVSHGLYREVAMRLWLTTGERRGKIAA